MCFLKILIHFDEDLFMDQSRIVKSSEHDARMDEFMGENLISDIPFVWPSSSPMSFPSYIV